MVTALVRVYRLALLLYPAAFRRRYADEMRLDFEDALHDAVVAGAVASLLFLCRQCADVGSSLLREWSRGTNAATAAATTVVTVALWGLALRPWTWKPGNPLPSRATVVPQPIEVWQLFVIAIVAMVPVIVLIVFAPRLVQRVPTHRRRPLVAGPPSVHALQKTAKSGLAKSQASASSR